jgi:uncharacterized protein (DUF1810 family)
LDDPHNLDRFLRAQADAYAQALGELRRGRKASHWIWFIFPQVAGLGSSPTSRLYAIATLDEARAYAAHPMLGPRLIECATAMLSHQGLTARDILGTPDDLKFRSSMTLFAAALPEEALFADALERFFGGAGDPLTLAKLGLGSG